MDQNAPQFLRRHGMLLLFCVFGFAVNFLTYYPGFISPDTVDQYGQALAGRYGSWHPPTMAFTMRVLNHIYQGIQPMLALQLFFIWASCFLIASSVQRRAWKIIVCALFFAAPFLQNFGGYIIKDTQMALSWVLACALIFRAQAGVGRRTWRLFAVFSALLLLYGSWMRYNAAAGLPPLCVAWSFLFFRDRKKGFRIAAAALLFGVIYFGQNVFIYGVLHARKENTGGQMYFHDLNGIFVETHENVYPPRMYENPEFDTAYLRQHYSPIDITLLLWNPDHKKLVYFDDTTTEAMKQAWIAAVKKWPGLYVRNRWDIYLHFLDIKKSGYLPVHYYDAEVFDNPYGFAVNKQNPLWKGYVKYITNSSLTLFFEVWFWMLLNLLLLAVPFFMKPGPNKRFFVCLALSGFLYSLPQLVVANYVVDFRYIYWTCQACALAIAVFFYDRIERKTIANRVVVPAGT